VVCWRRGLRVVKTNPRPWTESQQSRGTLYNAGMYCLGCFYELAGLAEGRCPECGRPFSPDDEDSYGEDWNPDDLQRWVRRVQIVLVTTGFVPVLANIVAHLTLVLARFSLGYWPSRMGQDDPEGIAGVGTLSLIAALLLVLSFPAILTGLAMCGVLVLLKEWGRLLRGGLLAACLWTCGYLLMQWDPVWAWSWIFD